MAILKPAEALNKAYRKQSVTRDEMNRYKGAFITLLDKMGDTDEEKQKTYVSQFLRDVFYLEYDITPHDYYDLIIRNGKSAKDPIGVLFEVKAPKNKAEMVTKDNLAAKAMYELLLYYLRERVDGGNNDLKHLVITNIQEWYVFDAKLFEKLFFENRKLIKEYTAWSTGQKTTNSTALFYKEIAPKYVAEVAEQLEYAHFNIGKYEKAIRNADLADDKKLVALYKLMSPQHMLKLPFANDSNSLDKQFYTELLHIIGLEEYKDKGKKLISRKAEDKRDPASLLEMCIRRIEDRNKLPKLTNPSHFGDTTEERTFNVALELCITWMNRVLFLKLLEAQLLTYNNGDAKFKFLHSAFIPEFDELEKLFFDVLAKRPVDRRPEVRDKFAHIPYLNSSLFEQTGLEEDIVSITDMDDLATMPLYSSTVLKGPNGKPLPKGTEQRTLHYLFAFLDAYNFSSEGTEEIQEQNKRLINASVLGLIFEKINGYKDGSFFTPGFITMYMCRETIRRATVQKFNDAYGWNVETFEQLHEHLEYHDAKKRKAYNEVINSLKICDPAVGSGHFLVSALNEVIAIKYDLNILCYPNGNRVDKDWTLEIQNDELMITDREEELNFFQYRLSGSGKTIANLQLLQEALFNEKQTIIENCLFGVDINPNSVKICRLRLWIELLKNAYYNAESGYTDLETLPNIDINIKEGNSLVSRFALDEDLTDVFKRDKFNIQSYRNAVAAYKDTTSREAKNELLRFINDIKQQFKDTVMNRDPRRQKLSKLRGEYILLETMNTDLFGDKQMDEKKRELEMRRLKLLIAQREQEINDIEGNKIYRNAFEWRFEFPEVLDDNGEFVGFDVVIGNPPYVSVRQMDKNQREYYVKKYLTAKDQFDLYVLFIEKSFYIMKPAGYFSFITPDKFLQSKYGEFTFAFLEKHSSIIGFWDLTSDNVFDEASVYPVIMILKKQLGSQSFTSAKLLSVEKTGRQYDKWYERIDELNLPKLEFKVWRPLATSKNVIDGAGASISNGDISRYSLSYKMNKITFGHRTDDIVSPKIILKKLCYNIEASIDLVGAYPINTTYCITCSNDNDLKYLLGVLNSKLLSFYARSKYISTALNGGYIELRVFQIKDLPIFKFGKQEFVVKIVNKIVSKKQLDPDADTTALEAEIDQLVYQLYGLTEEEIKIVEESVG